MKKIIHFVPSWMKVLIYFFVLWAATFVAGIVTMLNDFLFFFLVALLMSWAFLNLEGRSLSILGFWPKDKRATGFFFSGLGIGAAMLITTFFFTLLLTRDSWRINEHIDPVFVAVTFLTCLWSAFVQEFVFRGYPFQDLLRHYKPWVAQILIALPFGLMHVNHGMQIGEMAMVMLSTATGSVLFGLAFLNSKDLMFPIGLHLGWNYAQELIPRTTGGRNSALVIINKSQVGYNMFNISFPYFFVVIAAIILIWKLKSRR